MTYPALNEFPDGSFSGTRALTVQFYTEANVKNGVQFEASTYNAAFPGLGVSNFVLITGAKPVALKGRALSVGGLGLKLELFRDPTYTGGTPLSIFNMNHRNPVASTVQILALPTVTNDGVKIACDKYALGSNLQGAVGTLTNTTFSEAEGLETIFAPNSVYLFKNTSLDVDPQSVFSYQTWYEGDTDLPLP